MIKINPFTRLFVLSLFLILGITHSYAYTVTIRAEKFGTVEPSGPQTIPNDGLQVTAYPYDGYAFSNWGVTDGVVATPNSHATTTITATKDGTVTAYFKEELHTVKIQSNNTDYGRVSHPSTSVGQINASSEITATANPGYKFTGWEVVKGEGNITILNPENTITRIKAKGEGTIQANFVATTDIDIYFRPNNYWTKGGNEKFAVKYQTDGDSEWEFMSQVPNNTDYYVVTIPGAATQLMFGRFAHNGTQLYNRTDWIEIDNDKNLFDLRPHFQPLADWDTDDARFAAKFTQNGVSHWESMTDDDNDGIYECEYPNTEPFKSNSKANVVFCRMKLNTTNSDANIYIGAYGDNITGEVKNYDALYGFDVNANDNTSGDPKNLFIGAGNNTVPTASTHWETYMPPTYAVTLYKSKFGPYGFVYGGIQYFSPSLENDTTYFIPKGDTVTLFSTPYNEAYNGDIMIRQGDNRFEITPESGDPILEISSATILDDNYKTKGTHTVYLAMPKSTWHGKAGKNYLRAYHSRSQIQKDTAIVEMDSIGEALDKDEVLNVYYSCEVPAGKNTIHFEKRADANSFASSDYRTISLAYEIPLSSINCYILVNKQDGNNHKFYGSWDDAPGFNGDYQLIYYTGKKDAYGKDITFSSDIIRAGITNQTVSLHIAEDTINAKLQLQKFDTEWQIIETKSINDIDVIAQNATGGGVWNFDVQITDNTPPIDYDYGVYPYNGNYYIRTNNAEGGWRNYTLSTNLMTRSSYEGSGYTHYFCRRIDIIQDSKDPGHNNNVKFIIANDYGAVISTELAEDDYTNTGGILPADANVRWTWDEKTNQVSRAYIKTEETNNLITNYTNSETPLSAELKEQKNWIYEADIKEIQPGSELNSIQASYKEKTQNFLKNAQDMILADGDNTNTYTIRVIYDFKINKTMVMIIPDNEYDANVGIDVLLDRTNQDEATQVKSTITKNDKFNIYATMTFTKEHLEDLNKTEWERLYYWISFPFDVRISDVFGFGDYGKHWIIEYYDGKGRAENGYWTDGPSYWRWVSDTTGTKGILKANQGYVLALNRGIANMGVFEDSEIARLYFPSINTIEQIDGNMQNVTVKLEEYACTIEEDNRKVYDSNWHMIGAPSYADKTQTLTQSDVFFYYEYITDDNTYRVTSAQNAEVPFKSLHSYMVQYAGTINWKTWTLTPPASVAARKNADSEKDSYSFRLELQQTATNKMDQTFITMQPEGATEAFDLNKDLTKMLSSGTNIYTLAGEEKIQLAGSVLPTAKTTIPVGVQVNTTGEYTFSMPDGTDGVSVTLVDNQTGVHTNMLLDNYTTTINAGTSESRFFLVIDPQSTSTAVDNINGDTNTDTQKYLIDNQLIIRTANGIYDAQGRKR